VIDEGQALAILRFVVPGFVFLKAFYLIGLRTRRTDLEWVVWSLVASAPITAAATALWRQDDLNRFAIAIGIALVSAVVLSIGWRVLTAVFPSIRESIQATAWDAVLSRSLWVEVWLTTGEIYMGKTRITADSAQTDRLDLYLLDPAYTTNRREWISMPTVEGILIAASQIRMVTVLKSAKEISATEASSGKSQ
jgi:hypothetical protein